MKFTINQRQIKLKWPGVAYFLVIAAFILYSAKDLAYNTAFVDEAIYATVGEEVIRKIYWENAISWMGGSYIYPVASAYLNHLWGLKAIRLFSMLCVLIAGVIAGKIGRKLGGEKSETITIALFLFSAISLDLAQLGTYDAPMLAWAAISIWAAFLSRHSFGSKKMIYIIISALTIALSVLIKYIGIVFLPVIGLLILIKHKRLDLSAGFAWTLLIFLVLGIFGLIYGDKVVLFFQGQHSNEPATRMAILKSIMRDLSIFIGGALLAVIASFKTRGERRFLLSLFFFGGLIPISYHLGTSNIRSIWKHLVLTQLSWAPLTGWVLYRITGYIRKSQAKTTIVSNLAQVTLALMTIIVITGLWLSFSEHWRFQRSWPSATGVIEYLQANRKPDDKIFAEASTIYKYHLFTGFEDPSAWASTWYVEYNGLTGVDAMKASIKDRIYDYVIFNNYFTPGINAELLPDLNEYYEVALEDIYKVRGVYNQTTTVWKPKASEENTSNAF